MIDTHSHIYSQEFDQDIDEVIQRAKDNGLTHIVLPNVDSESLPRMLALESRYPNYCYASIGLHPTSVNEHYISELDLVEKELKRRKYIAIGEIGIDLYWDRTFINEQKEAFAKQLQWSLDYDLPVIIHVRDSFAETMEVVQQFKGKGLKGVFHSFTGGEYEANEILSYGDFYLGINGIVTFKNSGLADTLKRLSPENLVLETDAPYLTPAPYRGKRNESAYLTLICKKIAEIYQISLSDIEDITTKNSYKLFKKLEKTPNSI